MIKDFNISFWNTGFAPNNENKDVFGCSVYGFSDSNKCVNTTDPGVFHWDKKIAGQAITVNYNSAIDQLSSLNFIPKFCIAFFNKPTGVEDFVCRYKFIMPSIPIIGGIASYNDQLPIGELIPEAEDLAILAVAEGSFSILSQNIYDETNISVEIKRISNREFDLLKVLPEGKWQNALSFYCNLQKENTISKDNFEQITFFDSYHRNLHCSTDGKILKTGANLPDNNILHVGIITIEDAGKRLSEFISSENSLILGCAGLRSLIEQPIKTGEKSLIGFLFGELITLCDHPMLGNLMLTKLILY
jgi:hypothetical protein